MLSAMFFFSAPSMETRTTSATNIAHVKICAFDLVAPRFDAREVEQIVHQPQKMRRSCE